MSVIADIKNRLTALADEAHPDLIDEFSRQTIIEMMKLVTRNLTARYPKIQKGAEKVMGGQILDYEAKKIRNVAISEGIGIGRQEGIGIGRQEGIGIGRQDALLKSIQNLMTNAKWTSEQAMDNLGIPQSDRTVLNDILNSKIQ